MKPNLVAASKLTVLKCNSCMLQTQQYHPYTYLEAGILSGWSSWIGDSLIQSRSLWIFKRSSTKKSGSINMLTSMDICPDLRRSTQIWTDLHGSEKIFPDLRRSALILQDLSWSVGRGEDLERSAKISGDLSKYAMTKYNCLKSSLPYVFWLDRFAPLGGTEKEWEMEMSICEKAVSEWISFTLVFTKKEGFEDIWNRFVIHL